MSSGKSNGRSLSIRILNSESSADSTATVGNSLRISFSRPSRNSNANAQNKTGSLAAPGVPTRLTLRGGFEFRHALGKLPEGAIQFHILVDAVNRASRHAATTRIFRS